MEPTDNLALKIDWAIEDFSGATSSIVKVRADQIARDILLETKDQLTDDQLHGIFVRVKEEMTYTWQVFATALRPRLSREDQIQISWFEFIDEMELRYIVDRDDLQLGSKLNTLINDSPQKRDDLVFMAKLALWAEYKGPFTPLLPGVKALADGQEVLYVERLLEAHTPSLPEQADLLMHLLNSSTCRRILHYRFGRQLPEGEEESNDRIGTAIVKPLQGGDVLAFKAEMEKLHLSQPSLYSVLALGKLTATEHHLRSIWPLPDSSSNG